MQNDKSISGWKSLQRVSMLVACTAALAACGGGGGEAAAPAPAPAPAPPAAPAPAPVSPRAVSQGFWTGAVTNGPEASTRASTVIMPDGTAWVAHETTTAVTGVSKVTLTGTPVNATTATFTGTGNYYSLTGAARQALTATATASTAGTLTGTTAITGNPAGTFNWASVAGYTTAATAADVTGTWRGTAGGNVVQVTWAVTAAGSLSGSSTTGCTYNGLLKPTSAPVAVYDFSITEDCAGAAKAMIGIATLNTGKTSLRVVFTADSDVTGGLFALTKQ